MQTIKRTTILFSIFIFSIFLSGCTNQQNIKISEKTPLEKQPEVINEKDVETIKKSPDAEKKNGETLLNYKNKLGLEVINNEIFEYGQKRGWVSRDQIFIDFENTIYSFEFKDGIDQLSFHPIEGFDSVFNYDGLTFNLPKDSDGKIVYKCNGPLLPGRTYEYCETNGEDFLKQYEFGGDYRQFSTGGGFGSFWHRIFIKKINGRNIVFEGRLNGASIDLTSGFIPLEALEVYKWLLKYGFVEDLGLNIQLNSVSFKNSQEESDYKKIERKLKPIYKEMVKLVESKQYLIKLKEDPLNIENEKKWDKIVNSFSIGNF